MKKLLFFTILAFIAMNALAVEPVYYQDGRYFSVDAGFRRSVLNAGTFNIAYVEATCYPSYSMGWEFTAGFEFGKGYFSFEPVSAAGVLMMTFVQAHKKDYDASAKLYTALLAVSSARLPIYISDWLEVEPYWNLLKLTKLYGTKFRVHADVGAMVKIFPFCYSYGSLGNLYICPNVCYDFGYKKNAGQLGLDYIRGDKSPFHGYSYGLQIGCYF